MGSLTVLRTSVSWQTISKALIKTEKLHSFNSAQVFGYLVRLILSDSRVKL